MKKHQKKLVKTDLKSNREFIQKRGNMVAFLLMALMITGWINAFQEPINQNILSYIEQRM